PVVFGAEVLTMHRFRSDALVAAALAALVATTPGRGAQQPVVPGLPKIAYLAIADAPISPAALRAFFDGLSDYGYVDGQTITVQAFAAPTAAELREVAAKAAASGPDILLNLATGDEGARALRQATNTIPIVAYADLSPTTAGVPDPRFSNV